MNPQGIPLGVLCYDEFYEQEDYERASFLCDNGIGKACRQR